MNKESGVYKIELNRESSFIKAIAEREGFEVVAGFEHAMTDFPLQEDNFLVRSEAGKKLLEQYPDLINMIESGLIAYEQPFIGERKHSGGREYNDWRRDSDSFVNVSSKQSEIIRLRIIGFGGASRIFLLDLPGNPLVVKYRNTETDEELRIDQPYTNEMLQMHLLDKKLGRALERDLKVKIPVPIMATKDFSVFPFIKGFPPKDTAKNTARLYSTHMSMHAELNRAKLSPDGELWKDVKLDAFSYVDGNASFANFIDSQQDGNLHFIDPLMKPPGGDEHPGYEIYGLPNDERFVSLPQNEFMAIDPSNIEANYKNFLKASSLILPMEQVLAKKDFKSVIELGSYFASVLPVDTEGQEKDEETTAKEILDVAEAVILHKTRTAFFNRAREYREDLLKYQDSEES